MPGQGRQGRSDAFQRKARREGYRARSTYKLKDIQKRSKIFKTGDKVLDTHLGGGSNAIAAFLEGFHFVGCEVDTQYYESTVLRFDGATAQKDMFSEAS